MNQQAGQAPQTYPFYFYGHRPRVWALSVWPQQNGHNERSSEHAYRLLFRNPPTDAERRALATTFETTGLCADRGPWLWSGAWALLRIGETGDEEMFFDDVEHLLLSLHVQAPLQEVVYLNADSRSETGWEAWTLSEQPTPQPGPTFGYSSKVFLLSPAEPAESPAPDPVFEQARRDAYGLTPVDLSDEPDVDSVIGGLTADPDYWEQALKLTPIAFDELPPAPAMPAALQAELGPGDWVRVAHEHAALVARPKDGVYREVDVWRAGVRLPLLFDPDFGPIEAMAVAPSGKRALVCDRHAVWLVDLPRAPGDTPVLTCIWRTDHDDLLSCAEFAFGERVVVQSFGALLLLAQNESGTWGVESFYPNNPGTVMPVGDGRILLAEASDLSLCVYNASGHDLLALCKLPGPAHLLRVVGTRAFVQNEAGHHELCNLGEAYRSVGV